MTDHRTLREYQQEAIAAIERLRQRHGAHPEWWELLTRAREALLAAPAPSPSDPTAVRYVCHEDPRTGEPLYTPVAREAPSGRPTGHAAQDRMGNHCE
jgi:hypothetical protein